jgi:hypothetical protein
MKAVGRLLLTYFFGSHVSRWLTLLGLLPIMVAVFVIFSLPKPEHSLAFAMPGLVFLFLGTSMMPLTLGRLSASHAAALLPGARIKLLASALLTVMLVALPLGLLTPLLYVAGMSADVSALGTDPMLLQYTLWLSAFMYTSSILVAAWLYIFIWFVSSQRNLMGFAKGLLFLVLAPPHAPQDDGTGLQRNLWFIGVYTVLFSVLFLAWPRIKRRLPANLSGWSGDTKTQREFAGREVDLLLGNARPWHYIVALAIPLVMVTRMESTSHVFWLFYLTIFSTVIGAAAGQLPSRARALWLRGDWSRSTLFTAIEKSAWRHNGLILFTLVILLLGVGFYRHLPAAIVMVGIPLVIIGTVLSTYLGLMLTRGMRVLEGTLGAIVMMSVSGVSAYAISKTFNPVIAVAALVLLAAFALALRQVARQRWTRIDWSDCRGDTEHALRAD